MYYTRHAGIAQLVEHNLAKVGVESSSLFSRSKFKKPLSKDRGFFLLKIISSAHHASKFGHFKLNSPLYNADNA